MVRASAGYSLECIAAQFGQPDSLSEVNRMLELRNFESPRRTPEGEFGLALFVLTNSADRVDVVRTIPETTALVNRVAASKPISGAACRSPRATRSTHRQHWVWRLGAEAGSLFQLADNGRRPLAFGEILANVTRPAPRTA